MEGKGHKRKLEQRIFIYDNCVSETAETVYCNTKTTV